jgi:hypothetical protein
MGGCAQRTHAKVPQTQKRTRMMGVSGSRPSLEEAMYFWAMSTASAFSRSEALEPTHTNTCPRGRRPRHPKKGEREQDTIGRCVCVGGGERGGGGAKRAEQGAEGWPHLVVRVQQHAVLVNQVLLAEVIHLLHAHGTADVGHLKQARGLRGRGRHGLGWVRSCHAGHVKGAHRRELR